MPHQYSRALSAHGGRQTAHNSSQAKQANRSAARRAIARRSANAAAQRTAHEPIDISKLHPVDPGSHGTNPSEQVEGVRLQKLLAQAGYGSRRKCEQLIAEGRVEIDGELVTTLGTRVFPDKQTIKVDGSRVHLDDKHITLALNKPRQVLSAMDDQKGRWTLRDIIGDGYPRIFHMGRLDYDSEGLILMTNDGELAEHVMHPRYEIAKTYIATVRGNIPRATVRRLVTQGVHLKDGWIKCDEAHVVSATREHSVVKVVLHSGKNRIVRRMLEAVGYPVTRLMRTQIGPIRLDGVKPGSYRILSLPEVKKLEKEVGL